MHAFSNESLRAGRLPFCARRALCSRDTRRALLLVAQAGPNDRQERRRLRDAAEEANQQARKAERKKRAEEKQRALVEKQRALAGAVRRSSTPGLAVTVAITAGVLAVAEVCQSVIGL